MALLRKLFRSDHGVVVTVELVLVGAVLLVGMVVGMSTVRDAVVSEFSDVAGTIQDANQSVTYNGVLGHSSGTAGADFTDDTDHCDLVDDVAGSADNGITFDEPPTNEGPNVRPPGFLGIQKDGTLSGSTHQFNWSANGTPNITYWWMYIGSSQGTANYYNSGASLGTNTSQTVNGLPTDGSTVWVRLWYRDDTGWNFTDCSFTASGP